MLQLCRDAYNVTLLFITSGNRNEIDQFQKLLLSKVASRALQAFK